jgi:hypothetical protein
VQQHFAILVCHALLNDKVTMEIMVLAKKKLGRKRKYLVLLPDAALSHMVKECRKLFSAFLCSKKRDPKSRL